MTSKFRLLLLAASIAFAGQSFGQEKLRLKGVNERLVRVERVLDQSLLELLQQVESLKREIRVLRGELENQTYELGNIRKRSRDLYLDTDQRITNLEEDAKGSSVIDGTTLEDNTSGSLGDIGVVQENPVFVTTNTVEPDAAAALPAAENASAAELNGEKAAYTTAYNLLTTGNKADAVAGFEAFLVEYPDGNYADNAWYWQGEARYAQREFDQAIGLFKTVISSFPSSPKVPDARLKIAYALFEQELYADSRAELLAVVNDYPGRAAGTLASKRLSEMDSKGL